jgi:hypothetical protein
MVNWSRRVSEYWLSCCVASLIKETHQLWVMVRKLLKISWPLRHVEDDFLDASTLAFVQRCAVLIEYFA